MALGITGIGLFIYYYEMPMRTDINGRATQLVGLRADIAKGLNTAKKLPEFRAQVTELEARLSNLRAVLPEEKDVADLLRRLQTEAVRSNIEIKTVKPEATVTKQLHAEWPISLQLDGTYHNLALFFDRVGKFTRIVNITSVEIKGKDKPTPTSTIGAACVATTFVLLDKPVAAKVGAKLQPPPLVKGT